jgi:hypothetical protein
LCAAARPWSDRGVLRRTARGADAAAAPPSPRAGCLFASDRRAALALAALAFVIYNLNFRVVQDGGDTVPARLLPFALLRHGRTEIDADGAVSALAAVVPPGKPYTVAYWLWRSPNGHLYSAFPIVTPVLIAPLYLPAVAFLDWRGWDSWRLRNTALRMEKLSASLLCAVSAGLLYRLARRRIDRRRAALATVAYAFGTTTWAISSQSLWQHGMGELLAVGALLAATAPPTSLRLVAAGIAAGLLSCNRPPDVILAAAVLVYLVGRHGRQALWAVGAAVAAAAPFLLYNVEVYGLLAGGYGAIGLAGAHSFYSHRMLPGIAGLLFSPAKGLLVFSPFLLFLAGRVAPATPAPPSISLAGAAAGGWHRGLGAGALGRAAGGGSSSDPLLDACVAAAVVAQLLLYASTDWRAGACYGPRYLTDAVPFLMWLLLPVVGRLSGWSLRCFVLAVAAGIVIEAVGAFCYPRGHSDDRFYPPRVARRIIAPSVWSPANAPFLVEGAAGPAAPELLPQRRRQG